MEYLARAKGGKTYETIVMVEKDPKEIYEALLKLGLKPGEPARDERGRHLLPTGDRVEILLEWKTGGRTIQVKANELVINRKTRKPMQDTNWCFVPSRKVTDPATGRKVIGATVSKNIIALHHLDPMVLLQNPLAEAVDDNLYEANLKKLPPEGTPITLIIRPAQVKGLCVRIFIWGRVLGVGFRAFTQRKARMLKIGGWVKNLPDGRVEAVAQGTPEAIEAFVAELKRGPRASRVERLEIQHEQTHEVFSSFEIRY